MPKWRRIKVILFTLIEVFADDRVGLLYMITHTLFNLELDIRMAKIATKADQIADVFYVRDLEGQKGTASNNGCSGVDLSKMGGDFIGDISFLEMFEENADAVL